MKTIEEIKDELAELYSWSKWEYVPDDIKLKLMDEVCQEYAKQVAEAQREACKEAAYDNPFGEVTAVGNTPLVTDNI